MLFRIGTLHAPHKKKHCKDYFQSLLFIMYIFFFLQVVNLQAQLASLKGQAAQGHSNGSNSSSTSPTQNDYNFTSKFPPLGNYSSSSINHHDMPFYENGFTSSSSSSKDQSCQSYGDTDSFDMGDLQSVAFAYLNGHSNEFMMQ